MSSASASTGKSTVPRPKVYIDSDVLLAATASARGASHIIRLSELTVIEGIISEAVQIEVARNLHTKFPEALPVYQSFVKSAKLRVVPWPTPEQLVMYQSQADSKDLPHLTAACLAGCHYLVTHNTKHYKPKPNTIEVLKPGALLERIRLQLSQLIP